MKQTQSGPHNVPTLFSKSQDNLRTNKLESVHQHYCDWFADEGSSILFFVNLSCDWLKKLWVALVEFVSR